MKERSGNPAKAPPRLRLRLTTAAESHIRRGHPWIYAESVSERNRAGRTGELAVIYDRANRFLAVGLYDAESPIVVRILHRGNPVPIDRLWWQSQLTNALKARAGLFDDRTTGYRVINGESDGWPGLVLDRYGDTLVVKLYTGAWIGVWTEVLEAFREQWPTANIVLRLSRNIRTFMAKHGSLTDGMVLAGRMADEKVVFLENGIRFEAQVLHGQKTGFFLDQRENRARVETLAAGHRVLNTFCFTGGFSIYAARGGARSVTNLDISEHALDGARTNLALNQDDGRICDCPAEFVKADAFDWLAHPGAAAYDLVILDPPSFAKREAERARAIQAYERLAELALLRLSQRGILVAASCSAHVTAEEFFGAVRSAAARQRPGFQELETTAHPPDHPATFTEARYLKCIYLRV